MDDNEKLRNFHEKVKELTGNAWCPYPNFMFIHVIMKVEDELAIELINERRKFLFPDFLSGEPQFIKLAKILYSFRRK